MATGDIRVGTIRRLDPPTADEARRANVPFLIVQLHDDSTGKLDMAAPHAFALAEILEELHRDNRPVYLEINRDTGVIQQILLPRVVEVTGIANEAVGDKREIGLRRSCTKSFIRTTNPNYEALLSAINKARATYAAVLVTEAIDGGEILDVRLTTSPPVCAPVVVASAPPTPPAAIGPVEVRLAFAIVREASCAGRHPSHNCIPFLYPDNGCWARAHAMCRMLISAGFTPNKIWLNGDLRVDTPNCPTCVVSWDFHVAPTLLVDHGSGAELYVLDPSLFHHPVPQATWIEVQHDPSAEIHYTDASIYYRDQDADVLETDPHFVCTKNDLISFRLLLALRSASSGPPPYANCLCS